ncbi:traI domain protein [Candidatus Erwinia dacicola]|nr:traI domain protein [Candidatus Erwinia dacicola]
MIKQPIISRKALTVTGDSRTMTLGDEVKRIEQPARLDIKKENWKPTIR